MAFQFRGHSFVGLNSFDLTQAERASVGAVVINYGGGVQDGAVDWLDDVVSRFAPDSGKEQFVYMHHDPRSAHPRKTGLQESDFGIYDATDSPISMLTFGHLGLGNSPTTGIYLPLITPLMSNLTRALERSAGRDVGTWMMEWMRKPDWSLPLFDSSVSWGALPPLFDHSPYNGRGIIEVINCNLSGRSPGAHPPLTMRDSRLEALEGWLGPLGPGEEPEHCADPRGQVSYVVFAHNDVPLEASWADPTQRGAIFREPVDLDWGESVMSSPVWSGMGAMAGIKYRNGNPPQWTRRLRLGEADGDATVLRLDDVGNAHSYHGFHLVTLYDDGRREIEWIGLPNRAARSRSAARPRWASRSPAWPPARRESTSGATSSSPASTSSGTRCCRPEPPSRSPSARTRRPATDGRSGPRSPTSPYWSRPASASSPRARPCRSWAPPVARSGPSGRGARARRRSVSSIDSPGWRRRSPRGPRSSASG